MIRPLLIGLTTGLRSLTPIALVSEALRHGRLPKDNGAPRIMSSRLAFAGLTALAAGELAGDKWKSAPDRIVPAGMAARAVTASVAGAALAPRDRRVGAALLAVLGATVGAHLGWRARMWALRRYGQTSTGLVEDALTAAAAALIIGGAARERRGRG